MHNFVFKGQKIVNKCYWFVNRYNEMKWQYRKLTIICLNQLFIGSRSFLGIKNSKWSILFMAH